VRPAFLRAKGGMGEGSGATLCHDIYPARPITTVSLAANTVGPGSNLAVHVNRAINDQPAHTAGRHLLSVVQACSN